MSEYHIVATQQEFMHDLNAFSSVAPDFSPGEEHPMDYRTSVQYLPADLAQLYQEFTFHPPGHEIPFPESDQLERYWTKVLIFFLFISPPPPPRTEVRGYSNVRGLNVRRVETLLNMGESGATRM
jgi:hypothetical protein